MPQFAQEKINCERQLSRREHFLADRRQDFLRRDVTSSRSASCPKEMGLLDVFLAA